MPDRQKFYMRMPRSTREFIAFMLVISLISVNIIPVIISGLASGFSLELWQDLLMILPLVWVAVIAVVLLTRKPAQFLANKIVRPTDSFNAHIIVNTLCSVLLMSVILTIVGTWIGTRHISPDPFVHFFEMWPRNFTVAFVVEMVIAQPIARAVMHHYHMHIDAKTGREVADK
ncbi:hypothetical protein FACS189431_0840 [Alphaproteobacteria bacterium]|nr:hypothetical protein FACS189431_0840 [Alphaproteobacteria bacterium]